MEAVPTGGVLHDHVVQFYDRDRDLVAAAGAYVADGLRAGGSGLVIATASHRLALDAWLLDDGVDAAAAAAEGRYQSFDASAVLAQFMVGGRPDRARFNATLRPHLAAAARAGRPVRAFGEMVALLWADGDVASAIILEQLWNDLAAIEDFALYCAYPAGSVAASHDVEAAALVCAQHSGLIAPARYRSGAEGVTVPTGPQTSELFLPVPGAVAGVRRMVETALTVWHRRELVADGVLIASELATNALVHGSGAFRVVLSVDGPAVHIAVEDASPEPLVHRPPSRTATGGRGLAIVERLAASFGVDEHPTGKVVWATVA
jgi:hypothetical protein